MHHRVGEVGVLEGGRRVAVPQQPADGQYRLALAQGEARIAVTPMSCAI